MIALRLLAIALLVPAALVVDAPLQILLARLGAQRAGAAIQMGLCRMMCALLRIEVRCDGAPTPRRPAIVVSNHVSWTDIVVLGAQAPLCFLAKAEVGAWPLIGWIARAHGTLFVDRARVRRLPQVNAAIARRMEEGAAVVLFAEATTGNGSRLMKFHTGHLGAARDLLAARADLDAVAVVPVAIAYTRKGGLVAGFSDRTGIAWFGDMLLGPHVVALLRDGPVRCDVAWAEPVLMGRGDDRKAAMRVVRARVRALFVDRIAGREGFAAAPVNRPSPAI